LCLPYDTFSSLHQADVGLGHLSLPLTNVGNRRGGEASSAKIAVAKIGEKILASLQSTANST
jgi:hypothetical protein